MSVEPIYQELFVKHGDEFRGTLLASCGIRFQPGFTSWAGTDREGERSSVLVRIRIQSLLAHVFLIHFYSPLASQLCKHKIETQV